MALQAPLAYTPGEPAGIGPDLILQCCHEVFDHPLVVICDRTLLKNRARELDIKVHIVDWVPGMQLTPSAKSVIYCHDIPLRSEVKTGQLNPKNAEYVLECLDFAIDGCLDGQFSGLVTGPLHKGVINEAGIPFTGHTEHLQDRCEVEKVVMMLASPRMRVALATTHLPLMDVAKNITKETLQQTLGILINDLKTKFGIPRPRILVAGLNPHAGEDGHMGREEIDIIRPVLSMFSGEAELSEPLPADTLFNKKYLDEADAVFAMYHDQGLPVLKFDGFGESVNITLGLPIVRTSVDHGTALDLAGTGKADTGSLKTAIRIAVEMASSASA